jgi:hypothetical protein
MATTEISRTFATPQAATAAIKRELRKNRIVPKTMRSRRTANGRFLSCIFMPDGTSDATYAKAAAVLTGAGFKVSVHQSTAWIAATSNAS